MQNLAKDFSNDCMIVSLQRPTTPTTASRSPSLNEGGWHDKQLFINNR